MLAVLSSMKRDPSVVRTITIWLQPECDHIKVYWALNEVFTILCLEHHAVLRNADHCFRVISCPVVLNQHTPTVLVVHGPQQTPLSTVPTHNASSRPPTHGPLPVVFFVRSLYMVSFPQSPSYGHCPWSPPCTIAWAPQYESLRDVAFIRRGEINLLKTNETITNYLPPLHCRRCPPCLPCRSHSSAPRIPPPQDLSCFLALLP